MYEALSMHQNIKQSTATLWYFLEVQKYAAKSTFNRTMQRFEKKSIVNLAFSILRAQDDINQDLELGSSIQFSMVQECLLSLQLL